MQNFDEITHKPRLDDASAGGAESSRIPPFLTGSGHID